MPEGLQELSVAVLVAITGAIVVLACLEYALHRRRLNSIAVRVHVNGTRGKSSVVRLIAAGLRQGGVRCVAKTTGTVPRFILPNGREIPVYRAAGANIIEQKRAIAMGATHRAQVMVLECMALQPRLQWLSEDKLVTATHGVITNARPDHLDVMGPTDKDVAMALAATVPRGGLLLTAEQKHLQVFADACKDRGTKLMAITPTEADARPETLDGFAYQEHPDNVALALAACETLGVGREVALRGMWKTKPDPGALVEHTIEFFGRKFVFVNGFAANDPISTEQIWQMALGRHDETQTKIALFNCRADRADRSKQLAEAYANWAAADEVVLIGTGQYLFARAAIKHGIDPTHLSFVDSDRPADIFEKLAALVSSSALIMGMGNIAGPGLELCEFFANRSVRA